MFVERSKNQVNIASSTKFNAFILFISITCHYIKITYKISKKSKDVTPLNYSTQGKWLFTRLLQKLTNKEQIVL